jgi:adenylate cyclase
MSIEIERKFLVRGDEWQRLAAKRIDIRQAYLASEGKASVRIRIIDNSSATITVKSRPVELRRLELEYAIPVLEAEALIPLRQDSIIEKVRHRLPWGDLEWEVDVFSGENSEIELRHEQQPVEVPSWIGEEVTGKQPYYNGSLAQRPFSSWTRRDSSMTKERRA